MIGREKIHSALAGAVRKTKGEATAVCTAGFSGLTRFANNEIHQNLHTENVKVAIRAKMGKRIGVAVTTGLDPDVLESALRKAEAIAEATPAIEDIAPLPGMRAYRFCDTFDEKTARFSPQQRAEKVKVICDMAKRQNAIASGLFETGYSELAVVSNIGVRAYAPLSKAELMAIVGDGKSSGYANGLSRKVGAVDVEGVAQTAVEKFEAGKNRIEIEPGDYPVILEHAAVADALRWLSYIGFSSKSVEEGSSFLAGRFDEQLMQKGVSIWDDGYEPMALGVPFDFEGMPKIPTWFVQDGMVKNCVHDTNSAVKAKTYSTGHAAPPENANEGALPMSIVMAPGDSSLDEMVGGMKRGILVTRFHYINGFIDTREGVLTGMTRDGTFLIEDGKIVGSLPNMRFMQSFVEAFNRIGKISADRRSNPSWWGDAGAFYVPAMSIDSFRFIGVQKEG